MIVELINEESNTRIQSGLCNPSETKESIKSPESPNHYNNDWEIGTFITNQGLDFYEGNVVKYICRWKKKNGIYDLYKGRDYLDQLIKWAERE